MGILWHSKAKPFLRSGVGGYLWARRVFVPTIRELWVQPAPYVYWRGGGATPKYLSVQASPQVAGMLLPEGQTNP